MDEAGSRCKDRQLVGVVLAGGRSRRFGRDKAMVMVDGEPLVERVRSRLALVVDEVVVVGGARFDVADEVEDGGPLLAIVAAWRHDGRSRAMVVLACDLPNIDRETLGRLVSPLGDDDARVPLVDGERQWLAAHYSPAALLHLEAAAERGERSMRRAVLGLRLDSGEGFDGLRLMDADTPEALEDALDQARRDQATSDPA